jgi:hypothetical protein
VTSALLAAVGIGSKKLQIYDGVALGKPAFIGCAVVKFLSGIPIARK